jgi:hypothetical protein
LEAPVPVVSSAITRRWVVLLVATGLLLVSGVFAASSFAGSSNGADQCGKPLSERVGGWVCYGP